MALKENKANKNFISYNFSSNIVAYMMKAEGNTWTVSDSANYVKAKNFKSKAEAKKYIEKEYERFEREFGRSSGSNKLKDKIRGQ